ncbi:unnamed protein product, partial [Prorocentrum cordatum]
MATSGGRLQRDLLPLPCPTIVESGVARDGEDFGDVNWGALHCRLVVIVLALNWEAGFLSPKFARCCRGCANAAQRAALAGLARRLVLATRIETSLPNDLNWEDRLQDRKIGHGGSEITTPHKPALEQVLDGLPPPGVAASIEAADVATGFVRDSLLGPSLALMPPGLRRAARGAPVKCSDGELRPVLRLIANLIPSNACQECIAGGAPEMPSMRQASDLVLAGSEDLLWSGVDRNTFSYVFRAPPPRRPLTVIGPPVPSRLLGLKDGGATRICLCVIGVGWVSAAGVTTHFHRNMLRQSSSVPRGISPGCEIARRRRLPLGVEKPCPPAWMAYIDNLEIAELVDKAKAEKLLGTVPALLSDARACYEAAGSPGSLVKDLGRVVRATTLGELVDGVEGVRLPPAGYFAEMASLTLWALCRKRASMRLIRALLGRWVRVHCFRRPLAARFARAWLWLGDPRCGGRFGVNIVEDLLMCLALSGLCVADMRLEVDHLVTASGASEAAGAVVYSAALTGRGRALAVRRQRPANAAAEEEAALITVFDGVGGGRRAFEILGLVPAVHLSFEAGAPSLAGLLRARGRIARALVIGGFPCQVCASLNVDRRSENVASTAESGVLHLNGLFERVPLEIEAGDVGAVKRPRLSWASWDFLPSYEAGATMVMAKDSSARRVCRVALKAVRPSLEEWMPAGTSCPGGVEGEPLPTFVRWAPRSQPRLRPAGVGECSAAELARWEEAGFAPPPYQFRDQWCIHWPDGRIAPPDAGVREKLVGFAEAHTVPCMTSSEAKADPGKYEALRRSLLGNSFQCKVVARVVSHWAVAVGLLVAVPSLAELHESVRACAGGRMLWAGDGTSLRCGRVKVDEEVCRELQVAGASQEPASPPGVVYVGRGSRRRCLGPSCRGNPFAVDTSCPREDAVALFAGWLRRQPLLLGRLEELRGAQLACRCSQAEACHADILLAELAKRGVTSWRDADVSRRLVMNF